MPSLHEGKLMQDGKVMRLPTCFISRMAQWILKKFVVGFCTKCQANLIFIHIGLI